MYELASVGNLPLPRVSPPATNKRDRDSDTASDASPAPDSSAASSPASFSDEARHIAGSRRVSAATRAQSTMQPAQLPQEAFGAGPSMHVDGGNLQGTAAAPSAFSAPVGGWYGYDRADTQHVPAAYGGAAQPPQHAAGTSQAFPSLELGGMYTTQSMMYDQVLSNLSASLGAPASGEPPPQPYSPPVGAVSPDSAFADLLATFSGDYGAMFPELTDDGSIGFSTWSNNSGYEGFRWGRPSQVHLRPSLTVF